MQLPPEARYARLTPDGVRYGSDDDRRQALARAKAAAERAVRREPIRLEVDEVADLPDILGGRAVRPNQTVLLYFPGGRKVVAVGGFGHLEAAEIQEKLQAATEQHGVPTVKRQRIDPAKELVIARKVAGTAFRGKPR